MVSPSTVLLDLSVVPFCSPSLGDASPILLHAYFLLVVFRIEQLLCLFRCVRFRPALRPGKVAGIGTNSNLLIAVVLLT